MTDTDTTSAPAAAPGPVRSFADFGVEALICESLTEVGITSPFPIQEMTLPLALSGADIIGQARTGTGKTLGFGLPLIQRATLDGGLQALVIVPTRELCLQVAEDLAQAGKAKGVKVAALYGGKAMQPQIDALEDGAHIVVGTPGRLLDLSRRGFLDLSNCSGLVLDEADEMLDLGFLPDVEQLIEQCNTDRQTLLFSATMPAAIVGLARRYMTKPTFMRADVEEIRIGPLTKQYFFSCHRMDKPAVLARILQAPNRGLCVVFCRTKRMADILAEELRERDVPAQAIHSDLRQEARERALQKFRDGKTTVLCATEVAARGLDIDDVSHVVNYDCPDDEKMYLHRIGRTGRAGAKGVAITFAVWNEIPRLEMIRRELDIEEEIIEVFSTSPLLDELFDLPAREQRAKVPSAPQARSGKASKSRRRSEKENEDSGRGGRGRGGRSRDDEGEAKAPGEDADADRAAKARAERGRADRARTDRTRDAQDDAPAPASSRDEDQEEQPRRRRRSRTRSERDERSGSDDSSSDDSGTDDSGTDDSGADAQPQARSSKSSDGTSRTDGPAAERDKDDDAEGDGTITRRRRRRGGRGRGASGDDAESDDRTSDASSEDDSAGPDDRQVTRSRPTTTGRGARQRDAGSRTSDGDDDDRQTRSRSRSRGRGGDGQGGDDKGGESRGGDTNRGEGRDGEGREGGGRNRGDRKRSGSDRNRDDRKRNDNGRGDSKSNGGGKGRNRGDGGGRSGRGERSGSRGRSDREGSGGRERTRQPAVSSDEARGDGAPRLSRKMEVQHLP